MRTNISTISSYIRNRLLIIIGVVSLSLWMLYPIDTALKLGLDLNGGVQLVLRVKTDQALKQQTETAAERLRTSVADARLPFSSVDVVDATAFQVIGASDGSAVRRAAEAAAPDYVQTTADGAHTFRLPPATANRLRDELVEQALRTIERRVNELGVAEAVVARYTAADQILVQLPGVSEVERAKQIIKSTAQLRLMLVEDGPYSTREAALASAGGTLSSSVQILSMSSASTSAPAFYVVQRVPILTGQDLRSARPSMDEFNRPAVAFSLKPDAARRFGDATARHVNRPLATVLDDRITSVATIQERIDGEGRISGVSREEMLEQVVTLNAGALPADLEYAEERTIGASLGSAAVRAGVLASLGGLGLVLLFMVSYYRQAGVNAVLSVAANLLILLAIMAWVPVTFTLPGIAGLILTIGMGVDSNVLIFERLKEELAIAPSARAAVKAAFTRVWLTIVDTHVTSLIAVAFLFQFGTMPIRGFATTLAIGLLVNVFTSVFVSRTLFDLALARHGGAAGSLSIGGSSLFSNINVDFMRWRRPALAASLLVISLGVATVAAKGIPLGIDFSGGTMAVVEFHGNGATEVSEEQVRQAVAHLPGEAVVQRYGAAGDRQFQVRLPLASSGTDGLEQSVAQLRQALDAADLPEFAFAKRELVSAAIGSDLQRRGVYAVAASLGAIATYIGIRFRTAFAAGAIAATGHDVLVALACVALAGYDLSLNVVAALLTIIGYSVNDTLVIFDRVRENAKRMPAEPLHAIVNLSVNQTLSRTVITAGTTFLAVLALYAFGGEALEGFAFTMLVGIVAGTYSTVFIASTLASASIWD